MWCYIVKIFFSSVIGTSLWYANLFKKIVPLNINRKRNWFCNSTNFFLHCNKHRFCIFFKALGKSDLIQQHTIYYLLYYILNMHISSSSTFWTLISLSIVKQSANKRIHMKTIRRKTSWTIFNTAFISRQKKCVLCAKKNMSDVIVNWQKTDDFLIN